ncbi:hypothetical protein F441_04173 [Phytophthora nicotianae CJ01A1]|uniref:Uncharacterized protein n=2 Tax=Phytophthora nicotianae TaxID=4792 RepID=W2JHU4_PHYNI|nr:hypothetical protein L915_03966 [Phytophthora nicotianae]ETL46001.1 hypothetical protein L916_04037 [Phytophthora nicotianae]ETP22567.1 hypothetical protein F441_04173 [Phytophthora nicotianae CJ01A1]
MGTTKFSKVVKVLLDQCIQQHDPKVRKYWNDNRSKFQ